MAPTWQISHLDRSKQSIIQQKIDLKTKPKGSLGQLEDIAAQIALIQNTDRLTINRPMMLVFAGDHGIAEEGVSITSSRVTQQMVLNFLSGGAAINCFCRTNHMAIKIIDAGIKYEILPQPFALINQRIAAGTRNFVHEPAMTQEDCARALELGAQIAKQEIASGSNLLAFGEMGIGNSSAAAAILAAMTKADVEQCVGLGTGITADQLRLKIELVCKGLKRAGEVDALEALRQFGGFEIAQICGAILASAEAKITMLIDGFIVGAAALVAVSLYPAARDYMIFAHQSHETGHQLLLETLRANPLLDLGLHLGEGSGAALALPLVQSAVSFYNQMASFEGAGVTL